MEVLFLSAVGLGRGVELDGALGNDRGRRSDGLEVVDPVAEHVDDVAQFDVAGVFGDGRDEGSPAGASFFSSEKVGGLDGIAIVVNNACHGVGASFKVFEIGARVTSTSESSGGTSSRLFSGHGDDESRWLRKLDCLETFGCSSKSQNTGVQIDEQATCDEPLHAQEYYRWDRTIE